MLLLPAPKIAKDAAKAVKRINYSHFLSITKESLNTFLDLPGINVTHCHIENQEGKQYLHLSCEHEHDIAICPTCQQPCFSGYDTKARSVRHLDLFGMATILHFPQRRFGCSVCGKPFTEQLQWIDKKRRQTRAFEDHIYERVKKTPRKHVVAQEGLDESTVLDIFKKKAREVRRNLRRGPARVLGVDEISAFKKLSQNLKHDEISNSYKANQDFEIVTKQQKQYVLVLSDLQRRCVLAVLPNRLKVTFEKWLCSLSKAERKAIKVVSMDMWEPYRQAVRKNLPHAQIVADRFHVVKNLNHQLDLLRRKLQREADEKLAKALKGSRWILLKNRSELTPAEEEKLRLILEASQELRVIYLLKEEFRTICNKIRDKKRAERFLQAWKYKAICTGSRYLLKFARTLSNWWSEFLNYFDDHVTQGFVEGINRAIRGIINRAFGFRNFDNFKLQILVEHGST